MAVPLLVVVVAMVVVAVLVEAMTLLPVVVVVVVAVVEEAVVMVGVVLAEFHLEEAVELVDSSEPRGDDDGKEGGDDGGTCTTWASGEGHGPPRHMSPAPGERTGEDGAR